jgi:glutathione-regulated potassium-efflux system ancillary protein KefC
VNEVESVLKVSELGVVLLLFLIGLELNPKKLWQLKAPIFGLGGLQLLLTTLALFVLGRALGFSWEVSLLGAVGLALSTTALAIQLMRERGFQGREGGKSALGILLLQDLAVIPILALLPLLSAKTSSGSWDAWAFLRTILILGLVLGLGRFALRFVFHRIAALKIRELFTALSLFLVVGMAYLMNHLQLSMALGAFLAGILLADSEYRHAMEADIEPFKGLLLGLFFVSIGMSVDLGGVLLNWGPILLSVGALIAIKFLLLAALAPFFGIPWRQRPFFALVLTSVGEFAFVIFDLGRSLGVLDLGQRNFLVSVSAVSLFAVPVLVRVLDFLEANSEKNKKGAEPDSISSETAPVIIAGFGRVGQIVGRFLFANGIKATVLDFEPDQIELLRRFGFKIFFGDATREDLLELAGAKEAKVLVVAIDDVASNLQLVDLAKQKFPHLTIVARARNVAHFFELKERGVEILERETFDSSLRLGRRILEQFGVSPYRAATLAHQFRAFDMELLEKLATARSNQQVRVSLAKQARDDIEKLFASESERIRDQGDHWSSYER